MTEPTDAELDELRQANSGRLNFVTLSEFRTIARAALAKWGAQPVPAGAAEFALQALVAAGHVTQERVDQALVLPGAPAQPVVPAGYALVPVEPTPEMVDAAQEAYMPFGDMQLAIQLAIAAAPQPVAREPLSAEQYSILVEDLSEWSRHVEVDTAPRSLEEHIHQVFAIHGIKGGQHDL